jgi:site-specific DNA recombinase
LKLIGYVRVSSKGQEDNTSLEEQKRRLRAYCDAFEHKLVRVYEDVGSGKSTEERPQFQDALSQLQRADGIIATKLDRIARNTRDVLALVQDTLIPEDKALILLDLNVDTSTPTGRMILTVMASVAELERDQINERCKSGREAKRKESGYLGGKIPYGYSELEGKLVPNELEQEVIRVIHNHKRSGKKLQQIANYLNEKGFRTKEGVDWNHRLVKNVINKAALQTTEPAS